MYIYTITYVSKPFHTRACAWITSIIDGKLFIVVSPLQDDMNCCGLGAIPYPGGPRRQHLMTVHQQEAVGEDWLEKMAQLADSQGTARPWTGIMGGWAAVYVMGIIWTYIYIQYIYDWPFTVVE
jgi:hypothetical protein